MAIVQGTPASDILNKSDGVTDLADIIYGYGGADFIFGFGGNDLIIGGEGGDAINGGATSDTAMYSDSNTAVTINLETGFADGGTAEGDILVSIENLYGSAFGDQLTGDGGSNTLNGAGGNDILKGGGGSDLLIGGALNDVLQGGAGADTMNGGDGTDTLDYSWSPAAVEVSLQSGSGAGGDAKDDTFSGIENVVGSAHNDAIAGDSANNTLSGMDGDDVLKGGGGSDTLNGGDEHDTLVGGTEVDTLNGGEGDDTLVGGAGGDTLHGGNGIDTLSYAGSPTDVLVSLYAPSYAVHGHAEGDTFTSIENLTGSAHDDELYGDADPNVLDGGDGDDLLSGNGGIDAMIGGEGNDRYFVDDVSDSIIEHGGEGIDTVFVQTFSYTLGEGADVEFLRTPGPSGDYYVSLSGNSSGNHIIGNNGINDLYGGGGQDTLEGRGGNDTYYVDTETVTIVEAAGQGNDTVYTAVSYTLTEGADIERFLIWDVPAPGQVGPIHMTGNSSGNFIVGNGDDNVIAGGDGKDTLKGSDGQDSFLFDTMPDATFNVDTLPDFNVADDTIWLEQDIFSSNLGLGNISSGEFVIGTAALDANDRIIYDSNTGALLYDSDGNGATAAIQFAELSPGLALTHLDFLVV